MRHIFPFLSVLLIAMVGLFMVLPHDACISKLVAESNCECAPQPGRDGDCCCCGPVMSFPQCGSTADGQQTANSDDAQQNDSKSAPGCFSISSDLTQMTGPDRAPTFAPAFAVVAILPLATHVVAASDLPIVHADDSPRPTGSLRVHQDNCVYLI